MNSYSNISNYYTFAEKFNLINSQSTCNQHTYPNIDGVPIKQMYESGANQSSLFSEFKHHRNEHEVINIHDESSDTEWISTPPEYYNVKKAKIAPMRNYSYETTYQHNKKTGRILRYFICKYDNCNRRFNKTWNFIDHVRIHTGEKPYMCSQCGKGFTQKGNYNKHMTLHASTQD